MTSTPCTTPNCPHPALPSRRLCRDCFAAYRKAQRTKPGDGMRFKMSLADNPVRVAAVVLVGRLRDAGMMDQAREAALASGMKYSENYWK